MANEPSYSTFAGGIIQRLSDRLLEVNGPLDTPCWIWTGGCSKGYGYIRYMGTKWRIHRLSWYLNHGPIPNDLHVLHHCDNRPCGNPDHLFLGVAQDNTDDMEAKERHNYARIGAENSFAKLKESEVLIIRELCDNGANHSALARQYKVSPSAIDKIANRTSWSHV